LHFTLADSPHALQTPACASIIEYPCWPSEIVDPVMKSYPFQKIAVAAVFVALLFASPPAARAQSAPDAKVTIGIFSRTMVVQIYYRSEIWKAKVRAMSEDRNTAAASGDNATVDRIDRELTALQALAQKQLAGEASLKNIYDVVKADWPAIAQETGVDIIVEAPLYQGPTTRVTDVTPAIVKRFALKKN
jgi:hypothetical protein